MADKDMTEVKDDKTIKLRVEKIYPDAPLPTKPTTNTDSGFDVVAHNVTRIYAHYGSNGEKLLEGDAMEDRFTTSGIFRLQPNERCLIGTGLKMTVGPGYEIQVRPRSGLALKQGLTVVNTPGTIDEAFRNEVGIILINTSRQTQTITLGDRIAQVVPMKVELLEVVEETLGTTERDGGLGHSGTKVDRHGRSLRNDGPDSMIPNLSNKLTPFNFM